MLWQCGLYNFIFPVYLITLLLYSFIGLDPWMPDIINFIY